MATIVSTDEKIQAGCVTIDQVVFDPKHLIDLLSRHSLPHHYGRDWSLAATGRDEIAELLRAALSGWIDFIFVPAPKKFVFYADHDEYTTFYTNTKSSLNHIDEVLSARGFEKIQDYEREL